MSDDDQDSGRDEPYRMEASMGELSLTVKGPDPDWVEAKFEDSWQSRLEEASEMKQAIRRADMSAQ